MIDRRLLRRGVQGGLIVLIAALLIGQAFGQPVLLAFVETGSMAPTLDPGDGFIAVPPPLAGSVEPGDVVVFEAERINDGRLTTHRVVRETDRGYITKGDANPFTDQDDGEPPVREPQIVAEALQIGGSVVVVPFLGAVVAAVQEGFVVLQRGLAALTGSRALLGVQGMAYLLLGVSAVAYVADVVVSDRGPSKDRTKDRSRTVGTSSHRYLLLLILLVVGPATAAMVVPAGTHEIPIVSAEFQSDTPSVVRQGTSSTINYPVPNAGLVPVHVYLTPASDGLSVAQEHHFVPGQSERTAAITVAAPAETGYYRRYVREHRYIAILPQSLIAALYRTHPLAPVLAIDLVLAVGVYAMGIAIVGRGRIKDRSRTLRRRRDTVTRVLRRAYE